MPTEVTSRRTALNLTDWKDGSLAADSPQQKKENVLNQWQNEKINSESCIGGIGVP